MTSLQIGFSLLPRFIIFAVVIIVIVYLFSDFPGLISSSLYFLLFVVTEVSSGLSGQLLIGREISLKAWNQ